MGRSPGAVDSGIIRTAMLNRSAIAYLAGALLAAFSVLGATLWLYLAAARPVHETFSAAVVNTAATLAAATFVGVFDMFFTLQQMRHNRESERRWEGLVAQLRQDFQAERERSQAQQAAYHEQQEAYREEQAAYRVQQEARQEESQQQIAALLMQNQQMYARLLELLERRNGSADGPSD